MDSSTFEISPYLKMISPLRTTNIMQEIHCPSPAQFQMSHTMLNGENDQEFCSKTNVDECVRYMDKECQVLGLSSLYNGHGSFDLTRLVNVAHKLLRKYQQSGRYREELESRVHRSTSDLEHSQNSQKRLRQSNSSLQNSIDKLEEQERQLRIENSNLHLKHKGQQDEIKKLKSLLQSKENQYRHEIRKKERQLTDIKERAQLLLTDRSKASHLPSVEITACLNRTDTRRSKWRNERANTRNEEEMYNAVMSNFERRCSSLQSENNRLRELLADVQQELTELTGLECGRQQKSPHKDHLQLPIEMIHKRLSDSLRNACSQLRSNIAQESAVEAELNSTFTVEVNGQQSPDSNSRKTRIIEAYAIGEDNLNSSISLLEEHENLSKEKGLFYKQRAKLEQEKQNLSEAALNLHKERKNFDEFRKATMNGATNPRLKLSTISPVKSPGRTSIARLSEHIEQVKMAVEEQSCKDSKQ